MTTVTIQRASEYERYTGSRQVEFTVRVANGNVSDDSLLIIGRVAGVGDANRWAIYTITSRYGHPAPERMDVYGYFDSLREAYYFIDERASFKVTLD